MRMSELTGTGSGAGKEGQGGGTGGNQGFVLPDKWQQQLPDDLKAEPSIQHFTDFPTLIKSFVNAQKTIGAEKIAIPGKTATDEDWMNNVYKKLGLPESKEKYEVKPHEALANEKEFVDKFKDLALQTGILPKQGQKLLDFIGESMKGVNEKSQSYVKAEQEKDIKALQVEWGKAYDSKLKLAKVALDRYGDDNLKKLLDVTGLGNNSAIIKAFSKMGENLSEDTIVGDGVGGETMFEPAVAKQKYSAILSDPTHPYNVPGHINRQAAIEEVKKLFEMAFPEVSA